MATVSITLNVDSTIASTIQDALAWSNGWQANINDPANPGLQIPNPVTKTANAKQAIRDYVISITKQYLQEQAAIAVAAPSTTLIT